MDNQIICGNNIEVLKTFSNECIDLVVTSPPYDNLRTYTGYEWDLEGLIEQLLRVMKQGGVVVWVVGDQQIKGSESGSSFKQALAFKAGGFLIHDTMIWQKPAALGMSSHRYRQVFEYMFVFSKGLPKTANLIADTPVKHITSLGKITKRLRNGSMVEKGGRLMLKTRVRIRDNIWKINTAAQERPCQSLPHPAMFPRQLARDHIVTWSNEGDVVLDPFCGSGTTLVMAHLLKRKWIGIDISKEYCELSRRELMEVMSYKEKKDAGFF